VTIESGLQLLHYRLIEKIGEGGMGVVWKAEDTRLHRHVALKFVPEESSQDSQAVDRHLREARAASALNHPHICSIHDIGEVPSTGSGQGGRRFIVMELLEGRSLQQQIGNEPLAVDNAVELAIQIAEALAAAHAKGIIHRDIKPANIFVVQEGSAAPRAKMLDFGLAKLAGGSASASAADDATRTALEQTSPGVVLGTVSYMSPEQALGKELDERTDIFSLGVVLYEMITGRRAFAGDTSAAVFDAILNRAPTAPVELNPQVPAPLGRIVNRTLEKDPALRYQSAADLCADLKRLRRDSSAERTAATPAAAVGTARKSRLRVVGLLALTLAVVLSGIAFWKMEQRDAPSEAMVQNAGSQEALHRGPSIAVVPFTSSGGDPDRESFSDGLTEDIITELSRYRALTVIACSSTTLCKDPEVDIREVGTALETRYVLHGRVRTVGQRIKVNVQLSSTVDGRSVWGTGYERDLATRDLFELQDELAQQAVTAVAGSYGALTRAELPGVRRKSPESLGSYDCVLRAYEYLQAHTAQNHLAARECLERVVEIDPDYSESRAWLGYVYADEYHHRWNERPDEYNALDRALEAAEQAVLLDDANQVAHGALALAYFFGRDTDRGKIEAYRAIELHPNNTLWLALLANYLAVQGDNVRAVAMVRKAESLAQIPPRWIMFPVFVDHYQNGRYEEALVEALKVDMGQEDFRTPMYIAATYGQLGRPDDAAREIDELRKRWPGTLDELRRELLERHAMLPGVTDHLLDGLRKAGF